jgi:hypothetical protein
MWKSPRLEMYEEDEADQARYLELDSVEEVRCNALLQSACYIQGIRCYHDRNVQETSFSIGDLVLHLIQKETGLHKLNSWWEGPFVVTKVTRPGSYRLLQLTPTTSSTSLTVCRNQWHESLWKS